VYAERRTALLQAARTQLDGLLEPTGVEAGLQTAAWLRSGLDATSVAEAAAARRVDVSPLSRYAQGRQTREGLRLGFAAVDVPEIRRGVRELGVAIGQQSAVNRRPR
jgi:GntR family transcriptional regulator/MocR family aminotransferase